MSNIVEIVTAVIEDTRRFEKEETIKNYVKKAVRHAHAIKDFDNDLIDTELVIHGGLTTIGSVSLPSGFKKPKLVRPRIGGLFLTNKVFSKIPLDKLVHYEAVGKSQDTYYITSGTLSFNSSTEIDSIGLIYYAFPTLEDTTETWIMQAYPEAIIDLTKGYLFAALGDKENSTHLLRLWNIWANDIANLEG